VGTGLKPILSHFSVVFVSRDSAEKNHNQTLSEAYIHVAVRARRERGRATRGENSFSRKRQHDDGRASRSRLVAIKQFPLPTL
jgi:hypothetical protein